MKLVFLGTSSAIPAPDNGYTSFLLTITPYRLLVDTGDNPVKALLEIGEDPTLLDAVFLTHTHIDHLGAFPSLVSALDCMKRTKPLFVVASAETQTAAQQLLNQFPLNLQNLTFPLHYTDSFSRDRLTCSLLPGNHAVPTSMILVTCRQEDKDMHLLYTSDYHHGDTVISPAGMVEVMIHEATYPHQSLPVSTSHSSALQAGLAAEKSKCQTLFLCHFEPQAYPKGVDEAAKEAKASFSGKVIVPTLKQWYNLFDG
ncbi:MAG: MBL fold metallo-hydrolase [Spirochaetales bacterium]